MLYPIRVDALACIDGGHRSVSEIEGPAVYGEDAGNAAESGSDGRAKSNNIWRSGAIRRRWQAE